MEFVPRYQQPFTIETAAQLDVSEITAAIERLQNSLQHLQSTQSVLEPYVTGAHPFDQDLVDAYNENKVTIGSQEERIVMLRFALEMKGIVTASNPHYDPPPAAPVQSSVPAVAAVEGHRNRETETASSSQSLDDSNADNGGVFL